jgi:hypothetical protein
MYFYGEPPDFLSFMCYMFRPLTSPFMVSQQLGMRHTRIMLSHKMHGFINEMLTVNCVFWFYLQFLTETFLSVRSIGRDMIKSSCKEPVILARLQWNLNFLDRFSKKVFKRQFNENRYGGRRVVRWGRTDVTKLTVAICNYANAHEDTCSMSLNFAFESVRSHRDRQTSAFCKTEEILIQV